jgi:hypothetical protein
MCVVVSERKLYSPEPAFLLKNVYNVDQRYDLVKTSLEDIICNPQGYTGRDLQTRAILLDLKKTKATAQGVMESLIARGELLEDIDLKADKLATATDTFKLKAETLNKSSCLGFGC